MRAAPISSGDTGSPTSARTRWPSTPSFDLLKSSAAHLDRHYLGARYPIGMPGGVPSLVYDEVDSGRAVEIAAEALRFVDSQLEALRAQGG